jgi:hypothetical protein
MPALKESSAFLLAGMQLPLNILFMLSMEEEAVARVTKKRNLAAAMAGMEGPLTKNMVSRILENDVLSKGENCVPYLIGG